MKRIVMIAALAIAATPALADGPEPTIEGVPCSELIETWAKYRTAALACFNEDTMIVKGKELQSQAAIECIAKSPQAITKRGIDKGLAYVARAIKCWGRAKFAPYTPDNNSTLHGPSISPPGRRDRYTLAGASRVSRSLRALEEVFRACVSDLEKLDCCIGISRAHFSREGEASVSKDAPRGTFALRDSPSGFLRVRAGVAAALRTAD